MKKILYITFIFFVSCSNDPSPQVKKSENMDQTDENVKAPNYEESFEINLEKTSYGDYYRPISKTGHFSKLWPVVDGYIHVSYYYTRSTDFEDDMFETALTIWEDQLNVRFENLFGNDNDTRPVMEVNSCKKRSMHHKWNKEHGIHEINYKCYDLHNALHEIGHALGLEHTHERIDRDNFICISNNFDKLNQDTTDRYDYSSVMHYSAESLNLKNQNICFKFPSFQSVKDSIIFVNSLETLGKSINPSSYDIRAVVRNYNDLEHTHEIANNKWAAICLNPS